MYDKIQIDLWSEMTKRVNNDTMVIFTISEADFTIKHYKPFKLLLD